MRNFVIAALLMTLWSSPLRAGDLLGASYETVIAKLGKPTRGDPVRKDLVVSKTTQIAAGVVKTYRWYVLMFDKGEWKRTVFFRENADVSDRIDFERLDGSLITQADRSALFSFYSHAGISGPEQKWRLLRDDVWERETGYVYIDASTHSVTVYDGNGAWGLFHGQLRPLDIRSFENDIILK